ncbi:MAG: class I SAM-dependent methyltransferase [Cyclobacteriaceae bacterium]|nr:class I SAM-dependent methyltransferase [Cyclobacteriaceae bacterium]
MFEFIQPQSVLDVGCGTGTWLKSLESFGIFDYTGIDGSYVNLEQLVMKKEKFIGIDLTKPFNLNKKFDLVVSLEVAEHLPEYSADDFIKSLVSHGDCILFSAAIPNQGGQFHINEQWADYWQKKFAKHGYYLHDVIRQKIWNNSLIHWWYRQNIFLVTKKESSSVPLSLVHPFCFQDRIEAYQNSIEAIYEGKIGVRQSLKILLKAIKNYFVKK